MTMALYHSQSVCPGPSISSSGLRTIVNESPWHFWSRWEGNENRYPDPEESDALILGKAAHALILGDEVFDEHFCFVPKDALRRPTAPQIAAFERTGAGAMPRRTAPCSGRRSTRRPREIADHRDADRAHSVHGREPEEMPEAVQALSEGMTEVSMIWQDRITGVWLKSRPDQIPATDLTSPDLKTFAPRSKSIQRSVHQSITDSGYDMQMALAIMGAEEVFGTTASECVLIMAQSNAPYTVTPVRLDEDALYWARVRCRHGIDTFAKCPETGRWPMPVEGIMTYTLPDTVAHRYGTAQINGELPNIARTA